MALPKNRDPIDSALMPKKTEKKAEPKREPEEEDDGGDDDSGSESGGSASDSESSPVRQRKTATETKKQSELAKSAATTGDTTPSSPTSSSSGGIATASRKTRRAKIRTSQLDALIAKYKREHSGSRAFFFLYVAIAMCCSLAPVAVYGTVYDLSFEDYLLVYLPCFVCSVAALVYAYTTLAASTNAKLSNARKSAEVSHKRLNMTKEQLDKTMEDNTRYESVCWSLFLGNAIYSLLWLFLGCYMLRDIPLVWNYALMQALAAVGIWQFASNYAA